jgi:uncharacterized coiled-coil protein SlyX
MKMGKVLNFPIGGKKVKNPFARRHALEKRFGELENRCEAMKQDIDYIAQCMTEDTTEMSNILKELAEISGYKEELDI